MLAKIMLRILCIKAGVKRLDITGNTLALVFSELHQKRPFAGLHRRPPSMESIESLEYTAENAVRIVLGPPRKTLKKALAQAKGILTDIAAGVNR
jgi:transcription-repair coupling factor (superfamily II helicase)